MTIQQLRILRFLCFYELGRAVETGNLHQSYLDAVNYLLKKFAHGKTVAQLGSAIIHHTQSGSMPLMQYADDLCAKSSEVADVYEESALSDIFVQEVGSTMCDSHKELSAANPQADLTNTAFNGQLLLAVQEGSTNTSYNGNQNDNVKQFYKRPWQH